MAKFTFSIRKHVFSHAWLILRAIVILSLGWQVLSGTASVYAAPASRVTADPIVDAANLISQRCMTSWCDGQQDANGNPLPGHSAELTLPEIQTLFQAAEIETGVSARLLKAIAYGEGIATDYRDQMPRQFLNLCKDAATYPTDDSASGCINNSNSPKNYYPPASDGTGCPLQADVTKHLCYINLPLSGIPTPPSTFLKDDNGNLIMPTLGIDSAYPTYGLGIMQLTADRALIIHGLQTSTPVQLYGGGSPGDWWTGDIVEINVLQALRDPYYNILTAARLLEHKRKIYTNNNYVHCDNNKCTASRILTFGTDPKTSAPVPSLSTDFPNNDYDWAVLASYYKTANGSGTASVGWQPVFLNMLNNPYNYVTPVKPGDYSTVYLLEETNPRYIDSRALCDIYPSYKAPLSQTDKANPFIPAERFANNDSTIPRFLSDGSYTNFQCNQVPTPRTDIVFVIDTTGSMGSSIAGARAAAINILNNLVSQGVDYRMALVDFKDKSYDAYASRLDLSFSTDQAAITNAINALSASGGGDTPEDVYSGLMTAINQPWRNGARKVIILMGDAGPHDPELVTAYTANKVIAAANAVDPANIYAIRVGSDPYMRSIFQQLADGTGGKTFDTSYSIANVTAALLSAINSVVHAPSAVVGEFNDPIAGTTGTPIRFDASHSFDSDGFIVKYEWDFNNDGIFDLSTDASVADHTYTQAYTGPVTLRVTDNDGNTASVKVQAVVSGAAEDTTPPVISITSRLAQPYLHTAILNIGWTATDQGSGLASSTATLDGSIITNGQTVDLFLLSLGAHTLVVSAADKAGNTASASLTFTVVADINSLITLEQRACSLSWIDGAGVCNSFEAKLRAAKASLDHGQFNTARNQLKAFIAELDAQKDKKVTQGYDVLKDDTSYVISNLP